MDKIFTNEELDKIKKAVEEAEKTTSAEIVPVLYEACSDYNDTYWKSGIFFSSIGSLVYLIYNQIKHIAFPDIFHFFIFQLSFGLIGVLAVKFIPQLKRMLLDRKLVRDLVESLAYRSFVQEEVFNTKDRTGILIFISFFEREVVLLSDSGIHKRVGHETWEGILSQLTMGLKKGEGADAIIRAIWSCGKLLEQLPRNPDDKNELGDNLRLGSNK